LWIAQEVAMNDELDEIKDGIIEKYNQFCRDLGMYSTTPKSCEAFRLFLKYGIDLPDEAVVATLAHIKENYQFGIHS
jgi:hypothetical protein